MAQARRLGILGLVGLLAVVLYAVPGGAQVKLMLDGRSVSAGDALRLLGNGLGMSAAVMVEELGAEVDDRAWPVVHLRAGQRWARVEVGQREALLDGRPLQLQAAPAVHGGTLYVPLHLVADLAGLRVEYDLAAGVLNLEHRVPAATTSTASGAPPVVVGGHDGAAPGAPARPSAGVQGNGLWPEARSPALHPDDLEPVLTQERPPEASMAAPPGPVAAPEPRVPRLAPTYRPPAAEEPAADRPPLMGGGEPDEDQAPARIAVAVVPRGDAPQPRPAPAPAPSREHLEPPPPDVHGATASGSVRPASPSSLPLFSLEPGPALDGAVAVSYTPGETAPPAVFPAAALPDRPAALASGADVLIEAPAEPGAAQAPEQPAVAREAAAPASPARGQAQPEPALVVSLGPVQGVHAAEDAPAEAFAPHQEKPGEEAVPVPEPVPPSEAAPGMTPPPWEAVLPAFPFTNAGRVLLPEGAGPGSLLDVRLRTIDGRQELVAITDGPVEVRAVYLPDPDRLVVDIPGAALALDWRAMPVDGVVVHQVRLSGEPGGVRLVADLAAPTGYTLLPAEDHPGFVVRLNHQLRSLSAMPLDGGAVALEAEFSGGPVTYQAFVLREPWRVVVDLFDVTVAAPMDLQLEEAGVRTVRLSQFQQDAARIVLEVEGPVEWPAGPVSGQAYPGPDGLVSIVLDADGQLAFGPRTPAGAANRLEFVGFVRENGTELVLLQGQGPLDAQVRRLREPERIVVDMPGVLLERTLGPLNPPDTRVVTAVRAGQADPNTGRVVVETRQVAEHQVIFSEDRTRAVLSVRPSQLAGRTVVVDAGHGGRDPGAIGPRGTREKDVNLAIALEVARFLEQAGARVILTRDRDIFVELANRSRMANALNADVFVSIHSDAIGPGRTASGTGTFFYPGRDESPETGANARLGQAVHRELLAAIGLPDRGVRQRAFHVLIHTEMPAVLVEVAFIDNPVEERLLTDPEFQRRAAMGITQGVLRYFADLRNEPVTRTVVDWGTDLEQVAAAFLQKGDIPADVLVVGPAAALGAVSETVAQAPEWQ